MNKYMLTMVALITIGCASKSFTMDEEMYDASYDTIPEYDADSEYDASADVFNKDVKVDTEIDASKYDAKTDAAKPDVIDTGIDVSTDSEIECLPGGELIGNSCFYPEPECCYYNDCPPPIGDYTCSGGKCIRYTMPKKCEIESCQQYCVNCWVPGDESYHGTCNGDTCECTK